MNSEFFAIVKPLKYLVIALIIEFVIVFSFFTALYSAYDKNLFEVSINGKEMNCYYTESYSNAFLVNAGTSSYNSVENRVNTIELDKDINFNINEYEVYYKNGIRKQNTNGWLKEDKLNYKKVNTSKIEIEIKRMNRVIYSGDYIDNLNKYIYENGRYYIHIYVKRKDKFLSFVNTHISFNVVVGGDNNEKIN